MSGRVLMGAGSAAITGAAAGSAGGPPGAIIGGIAGGLFGGISAWMGENADEERIADIQRIIEKLDREWQLPEYDKTPLTHEEYKLLNTYIPQIARYVEEQQPTFVTEAQSQPEISAQRDALSKYAQMSETGNDAISEAATQNAMSEADQRSRSARADILSEYAKRGMSDGGTEMLAQMQAGDQQGRAAYTGNLQAAADAQQRRMEALKQYGNMASDVRGQNAKTEMMNTEIMNSFNTRISKNKQAHENEAAKTANEAQMFNQKNAQDIANKNVLGINETNKYNKTRIDNQETQRTNAINNRLGTLVGLETDKAGVQGNMRDRTVAAFENFGDKGMAAYKQYSADNPPPEMTEVESEESFDLPPDGSRASLGYTRSSYPENTQPVSAKHATTPSDFGLGINASRTPDSRFNVGAQGQQYAPGSGYTDPNAASRYRLGLDPQFQNDTNNTKPKWDEFFRSRR